MHRSRCLARKLLSSPTWCVLKSKVMCAPSVTAMDVHQRLRVQVRFKGSNDNGKKPSDSDAPPVSPKTARKGAAASYGGSGREEELLLKSFEEVKRRQDVVQIIEDYFGRAEVKFLAGECGVDDTIYGKVLQSFKKVSYETVPLPPDLDLLFTDVLSGRRHVDDMFTHFIRHAQKIFPDNKITDDMSRLRTLKSSEEEEVRSVKTFTSTERNFITPLRAMQEYLLQPHDLNGLRKTLRRSPHADEPPILVYWRRDVEARASEIWGGKENIRKERRGRVDAPEYFDDVRSILKKYRKEHKEATGPAPKERSALSEGSGRIVMTAVIINGSNFVIKLLAWYMTGSHSLFAEAIHSLADTINQLILAYGIHKSTQSANLDHPYGYANMRHVASLISGVGIFCVGAGLSFYHGFTGLVGMQPIESLHWALFILAGSLVSEGATLYLACNAVRKRAKEINLTFREFILRGRDPSLNVVILEDTAAVAGVVIAASCMSLTMYTQSPIPDALGSLAIGGLLGGVASFIIYSNSAALVGRSIPRDNLEAINTELENDVMIRAIHDVKGIDMGNNKVRYKAEVDFDGRELTRTYLEKQDIELLMEEVRNIKNKEELEHFLLRHGENIVDTLGAEIDRIEKRLRKSHPEIRHCDLEIL